MYAEHSGPSHKMLQFGMFDGLNGSKKKLAWTTDAQKAFETLKRTLQEKLGLFLSICTKSLCSAPIHRIMPWEQSWSKSERMVPMLQWPSRVE